MQPTLATYPVFEANQVLTNAHLNQLFTYLDEQERLTRANLIGIGIVCGLEIRLETTSAAKIIHIARGCGITSQGYLVMEPTDLALVGYRVVKDDLAYPNFTKINPADPARTIQYDLWDLFPAEEKNTTALDADATFLNDKAVVLFLELKNAKLRNCSPNNCDDKGAEVTVNVRPMLIGVADLVNIIAQENGLGSGLTATDLEGSLLARLNLPDLRLPRYDVPNTSPATSNDILAAFQAIFQTDGLAKQTGDALTAAYKAFKPLLLETYPDDPFAGFGAKFGFLDTASTTTTQVRFLPYYYDCFDDLLSAYDEFCQKGVALLCACCPDESLFPRHLMLGVTLPGSVANPGVYRHQFRASSAVGGCDEDEKEIRQLFQRLVELVEQFTNAPALPKADPKLDTQIRITPSKLADVPLSDKAIPYYYQQTGTPPLFQLWNAKRNRRNRANQTLSYRSDEYIPAAPAFVTDPLRYDLEPYNFLRIEGHLGKSYQSVLSTLLSLKTQYRLPINIIALRTGAFDEKMPVDLSKEEVRFQDLESLYDAFREELLSTLAEGVRYLYDISINGSELEGTPQLPLLKKYAPNYSYARGTLGAWYEKYQIQLQAMPYIDVDQTSITNNTVLLVYCKLFAATTAPASPFFPHVVSVYYLTKLAEILPDSLNQLVFADLENKYQDLIGLTRYFRTDAAKTVPAELSQFLPEEDLIDHFDQVLFACKLEPLRSINDEYKRRIKEIKQKQFLSNFLQDNPGIQHKAGVTMGGTFILVYHDDPDPIRADLTLNLAAIQEAVLNPVVTPVKRTINTIAISNAFTRISKDRFLAANDDIRFILGTLTGVVPPAVVVPPTQEDAAKKIITDAVNELADGTVIADFFLPYLYNSGAASVQFVLPKVKPSFTYEIGCTNANGQAAVTLTPKGGVAPYSVKVDDDDYKPLDGALVLDAGARKLVIQDAETTESFPQTIQIGQPLMLGEPQFICSEDSTNTYVVVFSIQGGKGPYTASRGIVSTTNYTSDALPGDTDVEITITDSRSCTATKTVNHSCLLPLAFSVQVGCTDPNNNATVLVDISGGTAPYQVQIDQAAPTAIDGSVTLPVGTHQLVVTDAVGASVTQTDVVVPAPLTLALSDFSCQDGGNYRAFIRVAGGTPPYAYKDTQIPEDGATFSTEPFPSGQANTIEVKDSNGCTATIDVNHTCEEPCNLPCGGQSRRGAYRLWIQPSAASTIYSSYKQDSVVKFRFNGKDFDLPDSATLVQIAADQLSSNYKEAIGTVIKQLNKLINLTINTAFGDLGVNRLEMTYDPADKDPFGVFLIEYFVCDKFSLEFDFSFLKSDQAFSLSARYTNEPSVTGAPFDGAIMTNRRSQKVVQVPAFNYNERNQCQRSNYQALCVGPVPKLASGVSRVPGAVLYNLTGKVSNMDASEILAWVWDVPLASEPLFEGQQVAGVSIRTAGGKARLTAITKQGCFNIAESTIPQ